MRVVVDGKNGSLAEAVERVAGLLAGARSPLFAGLGTDMAGARSTLLLAETTGGTVDHMDSDALLADLGSMRDSGAFLTTPREVRNRADLVLTVGPAATAALDAEPPWLGPRGDLPAPGEGRRAWSLGPARTPSTGGGAITVPDGLSAAAAIGLLAARLKDRPVRAETTAGLDLSELDRLAVALRAATFPVLIWSSADLDQPAIETIGTILKLLNQTGRASGLPLGGRNNASGVAQLCGWTTGFPPRTSLARGGPLHDAWLCDGRRLLTDGEADCLLWISAFHPEAPPPHPADVPAILLCHPETPPCGETVRIEVGMPGRDHAAAYVPDGESDLLAVTGIAPGELPTAASVLDAIRDVLARRQPGAMAC